MKSLTFSEAWYHAMTTLRRDGETISPRGMDTIEMRWPQIEVVDPLSFPVRATGRDFRDVIGVLEGTSLVGQFNVPELFTDRVEKFGQFTDDLVFYGSYGARVHGRLGPLVDTLKRDRDSRQAVLTIFDSRSDLGVAKRDIPCTIALQFFIRQGALEMRVVMRSNDIWLGTPYDFTQFAILQASVAQALGLQPGLYVHSVGSLHLYERDLPRVTKVSAPIHGPSQDFPLWHAGEDIGEISQRARNIALKRVPPRTGFERWATDLLYPAGVWYPGMPL